MIETITLALRAEDAEPILRKAALDAAYYSALCDHITRFTHHSPWRTGISIQDQRKEWRERFLMAKRMVEAFGLDYEPTSEAETMTIQYARKNETRTARTIGGLVRFVHVEGGEDDLTKPEPSYRGEIHRQACHAAADRTVRRWREAIQVTKAA